MPKIHRSLAGALVASTVLLGVPFAAAAPAWVAPSTLDTNASVSTTFAPQTAQDALGNSLAIWQHNNGGTIEAWHAERPAGGVWTTGTKLSTGTGIAAPHAARSASGEGIYAWSSSQGVRASLVSANGAVSAPVTVDATGITQVVAAAVAPNGDRLVVWSVQPLCACWSLSSRRYSAATGTWSDRMDLTPVAEENAEVGLAALPDGTFVAAWRGDDATPPQASALAPGATTWPAADSIDATAVTEGGVGLAVHPDGKVTAAWRTAAAVRAAERAVASGVWQTPDTVRPDQGPVAVRSPKVAAAGADAVVVWREGTLAIDQDQIYASRHSAAAWSSPGSISPANASSGVDPEVAGLADGRAVAIWPTSTNVQGATMTSAGAWGGPATVSASGAVAPDGISISSDGVGNVLAGWDQFVSGTSRRTAVAAYDGAGPAFSGVSVPTTAYVNVPYRVKATVTDPWSALSGTPAWGFGGPGKAGPQRVRAFDVAASYDTYLYSKAGSVDVKISAVDELQQVGELTTKVTVRKPRAAVCKKVSSAKNPKKRTKFRVGTNDIKANQRLTQEAIRKLNAVQRWLDEGIRARDICGGALPHWKLDSRLLVGTTLPSQKAVRANPRPLKIVKKSKSGVRFTTRPSQFAKNQRISAAAIRRLNALNKRLNKQLTGGDIVDGQLGRNRLVQGAAILAAAPDPTPPAKSTSKPKKPTSKKVTFKRTTGQVRTNYNIARQALVRANKVYDRARRGLVANNFKNNSITQQDFAASSLPQPSTG